jgi:hypothetical protein
VRGQAGQDIGQPQEGSGMESTFVAAPQDVYSYYGHVSSQGPRVARPWRTDSDLERI